MKIWRKIIGCLLIIIAVLFSFATFMSLAKALLIDCVRELKESTAQGTGYLIGTLVMGTLFILLIIYLFKSGLRLIKTQAVPEETIEDIGKT